MYGDWQLLRHVSISMVLRYHQYCYQNKRSNHYYSRPMMYDMVQMFMLALDCRSLKQMFLIRVDNTISTILLFCIWKLYISLFIFNGDFRYFRSNLISVLFGCLGRRGRPWCVLAQNYTPWTCRRMFVQISDSTLL